MNNFRKNFLEQHRPEKKIQVLRREEDKRNVRLEVDINVSSNE